MKGYGLFKRSRAQIKIKKTMLAWGAQNSSGVHAECMPNNTNL